jgi:hypothetical protein
MNTIFDLVASVGFSSTRTFSGKARGGCAAAIETVRHIIVQAIRPDMDHPPRSIIGGEAR